MRCSRIRRRLVAYVDGELPEGVRSVIKRHLEWCPECRRAQTDIRALNTLLIHAPGMAVPFGFSSKVIESLREKDAGNIWIDLLSFRFLPMPAFAQLAAAIVILGVALLGVHIGTSFSPHKQESKILQIAEFGWISPASIESDYLELMIILRSDISKDRI